VRYLSGRSLCSLSLVLLAIVAVGLISSVAFAQQCQPYPDCAYQSGTQIALTWTALATYNPTAQFLTATAPAPTASGFPNLLPSPTSFEQSDECPSGEWDMANLDPAWSVACRQCLPEETDEAGLFPVFSTQVISPIDVVQIPTVIIPTLVPTDVTPSITPTPSLTPTGTPTPTGTWYQHAIIDFDGRADVPYVMGAHPALPAYIASGGVTGNAMWSDAYVYDGTHAVVGWLEGTDITLYFRIFLSTAWDIHHVSFELKNTSLTSAVCGGNTNGYWTTAANGAPIGAVGSTNPSWSSGITDYRLGVLYVANGWETGATANGFDDLLMAWGWCTTNSSMRLAIDNVDIAYLGTPFTHTPTFTPSPTGTLTNTPTPSITPSPTSPLTPSPTPNRDFLIGADCRVPVYRPIGVPVDIGVEPGGESACYRLFPQIDIDNEVILPIHIHTASIDLCFDFLAPTLSIMGLVIDLQFVMSVIFVLYIVYWGLHSA